MANSTNASDDMQVGCMVGLSGGGLLVWVGRREGGRQELDVGHLPHRQMVMLRRWMGGLKEGRGRWTGGL
jgi:hypothetical protein